MSQHFSKYNIRHVPSCDNINVLIIKICRSCTPAYAFGTKKLPDNLYKCPTYARFIFRAEKPQTHNMLSDFDKTIQRARAEFYI